MYLIWALINTVFVILFFGLVLTLFAKGKHLFNNKYGNAIIVVFVIGVIGMLGAKESKDFENTYILDHKPIQGHHVKMMHMTIEDNVPFDIYLTVDFKKNDKGALIPSRSRSNLNGFISGYKWQYRYADIDNIDATTFSYEVRGSMYWYLFGIEVYSQSKILKGTFTIDE
ncbi:hypothetical protein [Kordia sp.]|uniref:hypothetical protein n=1 Tax=Kordia sp. TaxID=1965332 RepID=UPI003B59D0FA